LQEREGESKQVRQLVKIDHRLKARCCPFSHSIPAIGSCT